MFQNNALEDYDGGDATWEIIIMLLVAFILGYLLRYFTGGSSSKHQTEIDELEAEKQRLSGRVNSLDSDLRASQKQNAQLTADLDACRASKASMEGADASAASVAMPLMGESATPPAADTEEASSVAMPSTPSDDLKVVEGIGPKIESMLNAQGIYTFKQLADTDTEKIQSILSSEGPKFVAVHDPSTWSRQASLAARGEWDALKAYKDELKGGKEA